MADLTARDIAAIIHRHDEPLSGAIDRVRYWTDLGVLKAKGPKSPGTGHKRRYPADAIMAAGILQSLVDATGSPAIAMRKDMGEMIASLQGLLRQEALASFLLVVGKSPSGHISEFHLIPPEDLGEHVAKSRLDVHAVIRLRQDWLISALTDLETTDVSPQKKMENRKGRRVRSVDR